MQDVNCQRCEDCPEGYYINRSCPGGNVLQQDTRQCAPCKKQCQPGFFPEGRCSGSGTSDAVQCKECLQTCPPGMYMHAPCDGRSTMLPDCRQCNSCGSGMFMSSGGCTNGTAKHPEDRICSPCKKCQAGTQRLLDPCISGLSLEDTVTCESCPACPAGNFISRPCDGESSTQRTCSQCKSCPAGFFRQGPLCMQGIAMQTDDVRCEKCSSCSAGNFTSMQCSGNGYSPLERTCSSCPRCKFGEYVASPCTGSAVGASDAVCKPCTRSACPAGTYIQEAGCAAGENDVPPICSACGNECRDNHFLLSPCTGRSLGFQDFACAECTCPDGLPPVQKCTNLQLNHVCSNGCVGAACMPKLFRTTPPVLMPSTTPPSMSRVTTAAAAAGTSPASSTPYPEYDAVDNNIVVYGVLGSALSTFLIGCLLWRCCRSNRGTSNKQYSYGRI